MFRGRCLKRVREDKQSQNEVGSQGGRFPRRKGRSYINSKGLRKEGGVALIRVRVKPNLGKTLFMRWEQTTSAVLDVVGKAPTHHEKVSTTIRRYLCFC